MSAFADRVRSGDWTGYTGKPIRNVVNVGIGGSDLGPVMAYEALRYYSDRNLTFRFVSNVDSTDFVEATRDLHADETLFIISSKTFSTLETLTNATSARDGVVGELGSEAAVAKHFVAVSTNAEKVAAFGIDTQNMFGFWDWVGGRYSMDSAIDSPCPRMIAIGPGNFEDMLVEASTRWMSTSAPRRWRRISPSSWVSSASGTPTSSTRRPSASCRTTEYLKRFPAYLQQLTMESNGKSVTLTGRPVDYPTGQVFWASPARYGQHGVFIELIHQGTRLIPVDLVGFGKVAPARSATIYDLLTANVFAQAQGAGVREDRRARSGPRARPSTSSRTGSCPATGRPTCCSPTCSRRACSARCGPALYEHSVFTQGAIWRDWTPFDQWGVELGKALASQIAPELEAADEPALRHDSSTNALIRRYRALKSRSS